MNFRTFSLLLVTLIVCQPSLLRAEEISSSVEGYQLGAGDVIKIVVIGESDLSMDVRLSESTTLSYPFLGDIQLKNRTIGQIEDVIYDGLKGDYLVEPVVTVSMIEYRPFYMFGEIAKPGSFAYVPGITLGKAIALAGGFTERASRRRIYLMREVGPTAGERQSIDMNETILPGDTITVEQSFF